MPWYVLLGFFQTSILTHSMVDRFWLNFNRKYPCVHANYIPYGISRSFSTMFQHVLQSIYSTAEWPASRSRPFLPSYRQGHTIRACSWQPRKHLIVTCIWCLWNVNTWRMSALSAAAAKGITIKCNKNFISCTSTSSLFVLRYTIWRISWSKSASLFPQAAFSNHSSLCHLTLLPQPISICRRVCHS